MQVGQLAYQHFHHAQVQLPGLVRQRTGTDFDHEPPAFPKIGPVHTLYIPQFKRSSLILRNGFWMLIPPF
jgi:hypothetical protein